MYRQGTVNSNEVIVHRAHMYANPLLMYRPGTVNSNGNEFIVHRVFMYVNPLLMIRPYTTTIAYTVSNRRGLNLLLSYIKSKQL